MQVPVCRSGSSRYAGYRKVAGEISTLCQFLLSQPPTINERQRMMYVY
jgi:hypothetical protein